MEHWLEEESEKLARSWMRHEPGMLRDYLVSSVEDPRINLQSVFSRHFLLRAMDAERYSLLMEQEIRFAAVMNCLQKMAAGFSTSEELMGVLYALRRGAGNIEGIEIPPFILRSFGVLPVVAGEVRIPNYIEGFLSGTQFEKGEIKPD